RQTGPLSSLAWQHGRAHREADEPGRRLSLDPPGGGCADLKQPSSSGEGIEKTEVCRVGSHGGYGGRQRIATFWAEDAPGIFTKVATRRLGGGPPENIQAVRENAPCLNRFVVLSSTRPRRGSFRSSQLNCVIPTATRWRFG